MKLDQILATIVLTLATALTSSRGQSFECLKTKISLNTSNDILQPCDSLSKLDSPPLFCSIYIRNYESGRYETFARPVDQIVRKKSLGEGIKTSDFTVVDFLSQKNSLEEGYQFLSMFIEIWVQIDSFFHDESQLLQPVFKIILFESDFSEGKSYPFSFHEKKQMGKLKWNVFRFRGFLSNSFPKSISFGCENRRYRFMDNQMQEGEVFIKQIEIVQTNKFDSLQLGCDNSQIVQCVKPRYEYHQFIQSCILQTQFRCPSPLKERIAELDHSCVYQCQQGEFTHRISGDYQICIEGYQTCDSLVGCLACDKFSRICFQCGVGFILSDALFTCQLELVQFNDSQEINYNYQMSPRALYSLVNNCSRPACLECMMDSSYEICLKCRYPYMNVHGACRLCGQGAMIDKTTEDFYCRKVLNLKGCSNYDDESQTCKGCFPGNTQSDCNSHYSCADQYQLDQSGSCSVCSDLISDCSTCAYLNQCLTCLAGMKLQIDDYSNANPNMICLMSCPVGFYEDINNFCAPCGINCDTCSLGSIACILCKSGFEVDTQYSSDYPNRRQRCLPIVRCPVNCQTCSTPSACTLCIQGYVVVNGHCEKCGIGCKACSSPLICTTCIDGSASTTCDVNLAFSPLLKYSIPNNMSESCATNCLICSNPDSCDVCYPSYVKIKHTCVMCPTDCIWCSDQNKCLACRTGFQVSLTGYCVDASSQGCLSDKFYRPGDACKSCNSDCIDCGNETQCNSCKNGVKPVDGKCPNCALNQFLSINYDCKDCPTGCALCQSFVGCVECGTGYVIDSSQTCVEISVCGNGDMSKQYLLLDVLSVKECDDANITNGDGCDVNCKVESGYKCTYDNVSKSVCVKNQQQQNRFVLESKRSTDNINPIIMVKFDTQIEDTKGFGQNHSPSSDILKFVQDSIQIDIVGSVQLDEYDWKIERLLDTDKLIEVLFEAKSEIIDKNVKVEFSNAFVSANNLQNQSSVIRFPDTRPITESEKRVVEGVVSVGNVASTTILVSVIPVIIFSNFSFLFNALDLFQMIYYLRFVNIRLPYNVAEFLKMMSNFKVPFALNFFSWFLEANPVTNPTVPAKFSEYKVSGVFLVNVGDNYSQVIILGLVHLLLAGLVMLTKQSSTSFIESSNEFVAKKLKTSWQWGWYLDKFWEMNLSLVVGCALQFYGISMSDAQSVLNAIFFFFSVGLVLLAPLIFMRIIWSNQTKLDEESIKWKWGMLYSTLMIKNTAQISPDQSSSQVQGNCDDSEIQGQSNQEDSLNKEGIEICKEEQVQNEHKNLKENGKYFFICLYARKILFGVMIVSLFNFTLVQLILIDALNVIVIAFLVVTKPFEKNSHNIKGLICEVLMVIAQVSLKFLIDDSDDSEESARMDIGWVFLCACLTILLIQMIFVLVNLAADIYKSISEWCQKRNKGKSENNESSSEGKCLDRTRDVSLKGEYVFEESINVSANQSAMHSNRMQIVSNQKPKYLKEQSVEFEALRLQGESETQNPQPNKSRTKKPTKFIIPK